MAIINVDDAYILNETGAQVDKVTGLFTKNENATMGEKQMARLNIAAGGSNDNLLDNAYFVGGGSQLGDGHFPINQRGQTSYSVGAAPNAIDRWYGINSVGTYTLQSDELVVSSSGFAVLGQKIFNPIPAGTYTLSIKMGSIGASQLALYVDFADGGVSDFRTSAAEGEIVTSTFTATAPVTFVRFFTEGGNSFSAQAVKLEEGTVSTLANDGPPDFWEALEKCMRRFRRIKAEAPYYIFATVLAEAASYTVGMIDLPVPMASKPTISHNGSFRLWTGTGENPVTVSSIGIFDAVCPLTNCSRIGIIVYPSVNITVDARYDLQANNDANAYIDLSCEI